MEMEILSKLLIVAVFALAGGTFFWHFFCMGIVWMMLSNGSVKAFFAFMVALFLYAMGGGSSLVFLNHFLFSSPLWADIGLVTGLGFWSTGFIMYFIILGDDGQDGGWRKKMRKWSKKTASKLKSFLPAPAPIPAPVRK